MAKPTIIIGLLLVVVGLAGYFSAHEPAPTALIPAAIGVLLVILGAVALNPAARKHAMHAAAMVGLLAIIGDGMQLIKTLRTTQVSPEVAHLKIASMSATLVLSVIFLVLCIRSFIAARRNRLAGM